MSGINPAPRTRELPLQLPWVRQQVMGDLAVVAVWRTGVWDAAAPKLAKFVKLGMLGAAPLATWPPLGWDTEPARCSRAPG